MKRAWFVVGVVGLGLVGGLWWFSASAGDGRLVRSVEGFAALLAGASDEWQGDSPSEGRRPVGTSRSDGTSAGPPLAEWMREAGLKIPADREGLEAFVAWMRTLTPEELLRLSNAEYDFEESELVDMFQELSGSWVVPALGDLAIAEGDPLVKAILVQGLVGGFQWERIDDGNLLPVLDSLLSQLSMSADDPWEVADGLATFGYAACLRQGEDYVALTAPHLLESDNQDLLIMGYMHMGQFAGGQTVLRQMLTEHPSDDGRMGALEGLRHGGGDGQMSPAEITTLGLTALQTEENERNRVLLYEMLVAAGGEDGLQAVEEIARSADPGELTGMAGFLAMKMAPERALALFQDSLASPDLDEEAELALYRAIGLVEGEASLDLLLDRVKNPDLDEEQRRHGLQGLWNRPMDERLGGELRDILAGEEDAALRTEALRMLVAGSEDDHGIDLREYGALDADPAVRAEAVMLAAFAPGDDHRAWLEQRMVEDDSLDVKAAALGALVFHAHYAGEGDAVLGYLDHAARYTDDEQALAMIERGRTMVQTHDPRRLELDLAKEAEFLGKIAGYTSGAARRQFERQARQLQGMVTVLRTGTRSEDR